MSGTPGERDFVRRLKAAPRKSAALAVATFLLAVGVTGLAFIPAKNGTNDAPKPSASPPRPARTVTIARPAPDPDVSASVLVTDDVPDDVAKVAMQTVAVRAVHPNTGDYSFGTGFVVEDGIVVTTAHLLWRIYAGNDASITVYCDDARVPAKVLRRADRRDVIILSAPGCAGSRLEIGALEPSPGHDAVGYATGYTFDTAIASADRFLRRTKERVDDGDWCNRVEVGLDKLAIRTSTTEPPQRFLAFDGALIPGNSGAPLTDARGRVIGMFVIRIELKDGRSGAIIDDYSCFVPGQEIRRMLDGIR